MTFTETFYSRITRKKDNLRLHTLTQQVFGFSGDADNITILPVLPNALQNCQIFHLQDVLIFDI